jgi:hypothetical protein
MPTLDPEEIARLLPAETAAFPSPIPTQFVSSDEFMPLPQQKYGFAPLGPADSPVKRAIFGETSAALYKYNRRADLATDRIAVARSTYEQEGPRRTNRRYGYVAPSRG